jgi:stress-induced morphogen
MFEVYVTSPQFEGKRLLQRHKLVNEALAVLMPDIHALSIKRTKTPAEEKNNTC